MSQSLVVVAARARRALARPTGRRTAVALLAALVGLTVMSLVGSADAARQGWGETQRVAVATRDLAIGETIEPGVVELRELPVLATADAALGTVPHGSVVRQPVAAGEPLVAARLAPQGVTGVAALVPEGWRAVAVPVGPTGVPPLQVGDLVDVVVVLPIGADSLADPVNGGGRDQDGDDSRDPEGGDGRHDRAGSDPAFPLVEGALTVDVSDQVTTVAVPAQDAPRVAFALTQGAVVLALAGA